MKKLAVLVSALCFVFVGCNCNAPATEPTETEDSTKCEGKQECQLTEEQKAEIAAWEDWANQTPEKKAELVANRKACIDKKMAEKAEKCDATEEQCPEKKAKCEEMKAKLANWDKLDVEAKKALLDEMKPCCKDKKCCKEGEKKECEKKCEGKK